MRYDPPALLTQLEVPLECAQAAARLAHNAGAVVALDPSPPRELPDELLALVDVIKPNAREARVLTGVDVRDRDSPRAAARQLLDRSVGVVAIQAGDAGDLLLWREGEHWLPRLPVRAVDATGAGDAFLAGLVAMRLAGWSWPEAGRFASAAAALTTTSFGVEVSLPRREAVLAFLERQASDE
ncbi:MAG: PfkB family carbohydrate kinase [Roseiflexaceae bacterium]